MTGAITQRVHHLADSLGELKVRVRAALATELAGAVGTAVRDVLVVALVDRMIAEPTRSPHSSPRTGAWRDEEYDRDRDRWGEPRDPWADEYDPRDRVPSRATHHDREEAEPPSVVPAAAAVVVGANVGRWWLSRRGSVAAAVGLGVLATGLGLAGGPVARAALAVLAAATDLLSAESALARLDPS
jgi:hypothetical protein